MFKFGENSFRSYEAEKPGKSRRMIWQLLVLFIFTYSLTLVYLGMRGVMELGGMVASGGPYVVAHPAPDWIWIMPVSVILLVISIMIGLFMSGTDAGSPNLMVFAWSALFGALGWNFLEFGLGLGRESGLEWGWLICALFFFAMSLVPLYVIVRHKMAAYRDGKVEISTLWYRLLLLQLMVAALAIWSGGLFFTWVSK